MEQSAKNSRPFVLGKFKVDPGRRSITGPNGQVTIEPKVMAVLVLLYENHGEVVTREQFLETIWAREFSGDESLTRAISQLRKILGDGRGVNTHIETVPRTGYRLVVDEEEPAPEKPASKRNRLVAVAAGLVFIVVLALSINWKMRGTDVPLESPQAQASVTIAVLPFDIETTSEEDQTLAFGVADEILSAISRSPSVSVIAGNSSFQFQGENKKDLAALGRQLNISHVVDGTLRRDPDGLRVGVHLIEAGSGRVVWSDVVTRPETEIYSIPPEVASAVHSALGAGPANVDRHAHVPDPDAYRLLLQAKALLSFRIEPNMDAAIAKLEEAVSLDPQLIEAWETLAVARIEYVFSQGPDQTGSPNADPFQRHRAARQDANAALAIDPDSIDAQLALAILDHGDGSASKAETVQRVRSLLARAPNHPGINFRLAMLTGGVGRFEEAARLFLRALQLDPLRPLSAGLYADTLICGGREDEAIEFARTQSRYQGYQSTYTGLMMNLLKGDYQAARVPFTGLGPRHVFFSDGVYELPSVNLDSSNTQRLSGLIGRLIDVAEAGDPVADPELPHDFLQAVEEGLLLPFYVAQLLAVGGYQEVALEMVSRLYDAGDQLVRDSGILLRPAFHAARQDPSIMQWLDRTGLRDYWLETGEWPDFCSDPALSWDCETIAREWSG